MTDKEKTLDFVYGDYQPSAFAPDNSDVSLIKWGSVEGQKRLASSRCKDAFFRLAHFYQPQINPVYCGVASAVIVMNALRQPKMTAPIQDELTIRFGDRDTEVYLPGYSQITFLGKQTNGVKHRDVIEYRARNENGEFKPGLMLSELQQVISAYGFRCDAVHPYQEDKGDGFSLFRSTLKETLRADNAFMIAHFRCDMVGGIQYGHISPLAAWDEASDSVLVLDTGGHKSPWFWVPTEHLYKSMTVPYGSQPRGGGYLVVRD